MCLYLKRLLFLDWRDNVKRNVDKLCWMSYDSNNFVLVMIIWKYG